MTEGPRGRLLRPGDNGYRAECAGFNLAVTHHPAYAVAAATIEDVKTAIRLGVTEQLAVAVMATGHGPSLPADGAVLINTRRMDGVRVDSLRRTAVVEAGARWDQVLRAAARSGLAPLAGSSPAVGAVGFVLGGGIGLLGRCYGYASDSVREFQVVTADGRLRRVNRHRDEDLFWALRGGKGNFGVVVSMELELFPLARLFGGGIYFPGEAASEVLQRYVEWARTVPDQMSSSVILARTPDSPGVPGPVRGRYVAHVRIAFCGPPSEAERWIRPLREAGPRLLDTLDEMPFAEVGTIHRDPARPLAAYARNAGLRELDSAAAGVLLSLAAPETGPPFALELRHHGGAYAQPGPVPSAVGGRDSAFLLLSASRLEPQRIDKVRTDHNRLYAAMRPWASGGSFANFLGIDDVDPDRVRTAFAPADHTRLLDVKKAYDPGNLFRFNHWIAR